MQPMQRLKVKKIGDGSHSSEVVVAIDTADGKSEELVVDRGSVIDGALEIGYPVGQDESRGYLVELPRETLRGYWRVWVPTTALV